MTRKIIITGLYEMPEHVRNLRPSHLISVIQPELQPARPPEIRESRHLRVQVHDVSEPDGWSVIPEAEHVHEIAAFVDAWDPGGGSLLVHCYAGVSRSTATALVAHSIKTGDPFASARALREAAPHAAPNRRIVLLADAVLGLGGSLVEAVETMGERDFLEGDEGLGILEI